MLSNEQLQTLKNTLLKDREQLLARIEQDGEYDETESELSNNPADNATDLTDQTMELALDSERQEELGEIDEALRRIEAGTYGKCVICEQAIPFDVRVPNTTTVAAMNDADALIQAKKARFETVEDLFNYLEKNS